MKNLSKLSKSLNKFSVTWVIKRKQKRTWKRATENKSTSSLNKISKYFIKSLLNFLSF